MKKLTLFSMIAFLLTSCASIHPWQVRAKRTIFYDNLINGSVFISHVETDKNKLLSFKSYKKEIEKYFKLNNYKIADNQEDSDFTAFVSYGVGVEKRMVSVPQFGMKGGGSTTHSGTVGTASYSGTSYTMPTFGIVGSSSETRSINVRNLFLNMIKTSTLNTKNIEVVFEGRILSKGKCSLHVVMDDLIKGMFKNYPGENGITEDIYLIDETMTDVNCRKSKIE